MKNNQKPETAEQWDEQTAYNKTDGRRQSKRDAKRSDEIMSTPAKKKKQIEHWQVEDRAEKQPGHRGNLVLSDCHYLLIGESYHTKVADYNTLF